MGIEKELEGITKSVEKDDEKIRSEIDEVSKELIEKVKASAERSDYNIDMLLIIGNKLTGKSSTALAGGNKSLISLITSIMLAETKEDETSTMKVYEILLNAVINAARNDVKKLVFLIGATKQMIDDKAKEHLGDNTEEDD